MTNVIRSVLVLGALVVAAAMSDIAAARPDDDPCGSIPQQETWRFVMVVDGSGSMESIWPEMAEAIKNQISTLPSGAELDIVLFSTKSSGRGVRASNTKLKVVLDDRSRGDAVRWIDRQRTGGSTPLFYTLRTVLLEQEAWLREDPRFRSARVYIYTDGADNPGFDADGNQAGSGRQVTKQDVQAVIDRILRMEMDLGVRFEGKEIAIGGHQGTDFRGVDLIRTARGEKIPIPVAVAIDLDNPQLPPVRDGRTAASLRVSLQCPELLNGVTVRVSATSSAGFPIAVEPSEFRLLEGDRPLSLEPQAPSDRLLDGFEGELFFEYIGAKADHPVSAPSRLRFGVEAEERIDLDASAILIRPGVVLRGKPVTLEFLRPLADATPSWRRADGESMIGSGEWRATTVFETEGDATVVLTARRGDVVSEPIEVVIPVRDIRLQVDRIGEDAIVAGDEADFEVSVVGLQPSTFEWRINGRPLARQEGGRVRAVLDQPGSNLVEVRGQLDLGDGQRPYTAWVGTSLDVGVRPDLHIRAPLEVSWARPLSVQVLVDGDIQRVRGSIVDAATGLIVGGGVDGVVQTKTLQGGKGVDRIAELLLPLPERAGEFLVRAEGVGGPPVKDEATITLRDPVLSVTLDDPPPVDGILVGDARRFRLSLGDEASSVIKQVTWQVTTESGEPLAIQGVDEPAAADSNGIRISEFNVQLPDDGSIAEGQTLLIEPAYTTAGGVSLIPKGGASRWRLSAGYAGVSRRIVGGDGAEIGWGDAVVFSIEPPERIAGVDWRIDGPGGETARAAGVDQFEKSFDGTPGEYRIRATVRPDIPNAAAIELETVRTVTVDPVEANVEFPDGRQGRGEHLFTAVVTTSGSVKNAILVFSGESGEADDILERRSVDLKPGSGKQSVETSSPTYGPKGIGEIEVVLEIETPTGETIRFDAGSLNHRGPRQVAYFGVLTTAMLLLLGIATKWLLGNSFLNWTVCIRQTGKMAVEERLGDLVGRWPRWEKVARFPLQDLPNPNSSSSSLKWFSDDPAVQDVQLTVRGSRSAATQDRFTPGYDDDPSIRVVFAKIPKEDDRARYEWLRVARKGASEDDAAVEISIDSSTGSATKVMNLAWVVTLLASVGAVLAAWQAWMA